MKFCPYCGASLIGGAVSFCTECGSPLPEPEQPEPVKRTDSPPMNRRRNTVRTPPEPDPMDVHYDGYYDDVPPIDVDQVWERIDPALIKRITLVILGAVGLITLSAALLMLL